MAQGQPTPEEIRGFSPEPTHRWWSDVIRPRTVLPLFWLAWVLLLPARLVGMGARRRQRSRPTVVAIESGRIGWTQVFFEELFGSAQDYVGEERVRQQVIDRDAPYLPQFRANQRKDDPTHVVLDVRTSGQSWGRSLREALVVSWNLLVHGRTPVVIMTDAFYRRQRWHAAVLTAHAGVVLTFAPKSVLSPLFPHGRLVGPLPMPISESRLAWLEEAADGSARDDTVVQFIGHVYPPRSLFLDALGSRLQEHGLTLTVNGDKWGTSNEAYWRTLVNADVVVTTCMQGPARSIIDWNWEPQLVFRYNETLAAGAALVAARVPDADRFFVAGRDFLDYVSLDEAVAAVTTLMSDRELRSRIAGAGHQTSARIIRTHEFWRLADDAIPGHRMVPLD